MTDHDAWQLFILSHPEFRFENPDGDDREGRVYPHFLEWQRQALERAQKSGFEQVAREFSERAEAEVRAVAIQLMAFDEELRARQAALNTSRADVEKERAGIEAARGELKSQLAQLNDAKLALDGIDPALLQQLLPRGETETLAQFRLRTGRSKPEDTK